jgi:hypothetical protein
VTCKINTNAFSLVNKTDIGIQQPEKYKENFDVPGEGAS